jgi:hypothetical protein
MDFPRLEIRLFLLQYYAPIALNMNTLQKKLCDSYPHPHSTPRLNDRDGGELSKIEKNFRDVDVS